jgi:hypothetical protein
LEETDALRRPFLSFPYAFEQGVEAVVFGRGSALCIASKKIAVLRMVSAGGGSAHAA